ncbi:MAG: taurine dioxygenase [Planctomycetota bacterium]|nr:MAG: taurine dioxygenase [Planctomycetota bacterium]
MNPSPDSSRASAPPERATPSTPVSLHVELPEARRVGAVIHDLDARAVTPGQVAAIHELVYEHKVVVFTGQELSNTEYIAFARALGEPQIYFQPNYHHPDHPEIFVSSNVPMNGKKVGVAGTGRYWHSDYQFFAEPLPMTMVYPQEVGGEQRSTSYIDMVQVLADLPPDLAALVRDARFLHEAKWRYKITPEDIDKSITEILEEFGALTPTVSHPAVGRHPVKARDYLYASRGFTVGIEGMSPEEGRAALSELLDWVEREEHVQHQPWRTDRILLWDNRQVIHCAAVTDLGARSTSYRIGVYDGRPFYTNEPGARVLA